MIKLIALISCIAFLASCGGSGGTSTNMENGGEETRDQPARIDPPSVLDCETTPEADGCPCPTSDGWSGDMYPSCVYVEKEQELEAIACEVDPQADTCPCPAGFEGDVWPECSEVVSEPPGSCTTMKLYPDLYPDAGAGKSVIENDQFELGCTPIISLRRAPKKGELQLAADGTFTYVPDNPEAPSEDYFRYSVTYAENPDSYYINGVKVFSDALPQPDRAGNDGDWDKNRDPITDPWPEAARYYVPNYTEKRSAPELMVDYPEDLAIIQLGDKEPVEQAIARLKELTDGRGGIIEIVKPNQCDEINYNSELAMEYLIIRGIDSPALINGVERMAQPRFYCRGDEAKTMGTIPVGYLKKISAKFFHSSAVNAKVWIENIEVDGYRGAMSFPETGHYEIRKVYAHSGLNNGFGTRNSGTKTHPGGFYASLLEPGYECNVEVLFWQTEVSHYGAGNIRHNAYMHSCIGGTRFAPEYNEAVRTFLGQNADPRQYGVFPEHGTHILILDSNWHSARYSSTFKATSNAVTIIGSRLATTASLLDIDHGLDNLYSQATLDIAMMSRVFVKDSEILCFREHKVGGGSICAGARQRMSYLGGAGVPAIYYPYPEKSRTPEGKPYSIAPPVMVPNAALHTEEFWDHLGGIKPFKWTFDNVHFEEFRTGEHTFRSNPPLTIYDTGYSYASGWQRCRHTMPKNAYELVEIRMLPNVTYKGSKINHPVVEKRFGHSAKCHVPFPEVYPIAEGWWRYGVLNDQGASL